MNYKTLVDPELKRFAIKMPYGKAMIYGDQLTHGLVSILAAVPADVSKRTFLIRREDGTAFHTDIYEPQNMPKKLPALIMIHGGAFSYRAAPYHIELAAMYASGAGCRVFFPDYRLLPKDPWPAAWLDCLALYRHVMENAEMYGIDAARIGVTGDSAGAFLAALLALRYEAEALIRPCLQMLVYPMTDCETNRESMKKYRDAPFWNLKNHRKVIRYYFGNCSKEEIRELVPMRQELPEHIPDTYIETAEFDILHDEGILFGKRLRDAGAEVVVNDTLRTFHGYDAALHTKIVRRNVKRRIVFLDSVFSGSAEEERE